MDTGDWGYKIGTTAMTSRKSVAFMLRRDFGRFGFSLDLECFCEAVASFGIDTLVTKYTNLVRYKLSQFTKDEPMRILTLADFQAELKAQGVDREDWAFKCPVCGTVQSARDLIAAGAGETFSEVERYLGFSCVGRWWKAGPWTHGDTPGSGCDWSLGGFFKLHKLEVVSQDGTHTAMFEPASPAEAKAHAAKQGEGRVSRIAP